MQIITSRPLSEVQKDVTKEGLEQEITALEIAQMEQEQEMTELDIAVMELKSRIGG